MSNRPKMELIYYMNVFRMPGGDLMASHLSEATALHSFDATVADARRMLSLGFTYVCTLSNLPEDVTPKVKRKLNKEES